MKACLAPKACLAFKVSLAPRRLSGHCGTGPVACAQATQTAVRRAQYQIFILRRSNFLLNEIQSLIVVFSPLRGQFIRLPAMSALFGFILRPAWRCRALPTGKESGLLAARACATLLLRQPGGQKIARHSVQKCFSCNAIGEIGMVPAEMRRVATRLKVWAAFQDLRDRALKVVRNHFSTRGLTSPG